MISNNNFILVEVSGNKERQIDSKLTGPDGNPITLFTYSDMEDENTNVYNKISGKVISMPKSLNGIQPLRQEYEGSPSPLHYCGHQQLQKLAFSLIKAHKTAVEKNNIQTNESDKVVSSKYCSSPVEYKYEYHKSIDGQVGDTVYFHYLTLTDSNFMGYVDNGDKYWERMVYRVPYSEIYCFVREGIIIPTNSNVFVEPYFDESYEDIVAEEKFLDTQGKVFKGKIGASGLVESVKTEAEYLRGLIGDRKVIFIPESENQRKIEGKEYYVMKEWDIVAEFDPFVPIDPMVSIIPDKTSKRGLIHLNRDQMLNTGVVESGEHAGSKVFYNQKGRKNLYMREFDRMLVHKEDIMAIIENN